MVGEESFRVCKSYYLSTLAVSQKMIYNVHEKKNPITGVVKADGWGKKCHSNVTKEQREIVIAHFIFFSFSFHLFYSHKKILQGLQALQPNSNTKLIIKRNNS